MKQLMMRHANDDFTALLTASGMTNAGAEVFSITNNGPSHPRGLVTRQFQPHEQPQKFIVWARVRDEAHMDECDKAIDKCLTEQKP